MRDSVAARRNPKIRRRSTVRASPCFCRSRCIDMERDTGDTSGNRRSARSRVRPPEPERLCDRSDSHAVMRGQIGNRARDAEGAVPGPGREGEPFAGVAEEGDGGGVEGALGREQAWWRGRVQRAEAAQLSRARCSHAFTQRRRFSGSIRQIEVGDRYRAHRDVKVDAIDQWSRDPAPVSCQRALVALAGDGGVTCKSAWTRIHSSNEHK